MNSSYLIHTEEALEEVVNALLKFAKGQRKIALSGDLGAGKTAFVKAFCKKMGVMETVSSPTFALVNEYAFVGENGAPQTVHHLDLYRLRSFEEALDIGIEDYLYDEHYCFVEWPEIIASLLPHDVVFVKITVNPDNGRLFSFLTNGQ